MVIGSTGNTNVHIISRVSGSGAEWRLRELLRSSGFMARTGLLAETSTFCRARSGVHGKGVMLRHLNLTLFVDDHVDCLTDISTQMQGSATLFFLIPTMYASGRVDQPNRTPPHGIVTISDLGEVGC